MTARASDADIVAELRGRGMVGPIDDAFIAEIALHRQFVERIKTIEATPGAPERLRRALIQVGVIPPEDIGDERLVAAWSAYQSSLAEYEANGPDAPPAIDALPEARWDAADDAICVLPATTLAGAAVKLRRALITIAASETWAETALVAGDDVSLFGRSDTLDYEVRLIVDALAAIELVRGAA